MTSAGPPNAGNDLALRAETVITATGGRQSVIRDGVVLISRGEIQDVLPFEVARERMGESQVTDYGKATLLPGLIDAHAHLTLPADGRSYEEVALETDAMMVLYGAHNLLRHLKSGVTTIRDNGSRNSTAFMLRRAVEQGLIAGPRLLIAGRPVTHRGGHFHWCNGTADSLEEIKAAVRALVAEGADHIKIMASGGSTAGTPVHLPSYSLEELRMAVDTAHSLEKLTTAHCRSSLSMVNAAEAGLDCIEHAEFVVSAGRSGGGWGMGVDTVMEYDPAITERMLESNTYISFTMQAGGYERLVRMREEGSDVSQTAQRIGALEQYYETKLSIFDSLLRDGYGDRLALSTDSGCFTSEFGHMYYGLELATQASMSPLKAIEAATVIAAKVCGIQNMVGTLESGKRADVVAVRGDATANVAALRDVLDVYIDGELVG